MPLKPAKNYFCSSKSIIMSEGVSQFIEHHYRHFNAALVDAALEPFGGG